MNEKWMDFLDEKIHTNVFVGQIWTTWVDEQGFCCK
jgi:hypothetical protein